jgi:hypothetical protein
VNPAEHLPLTAARVEDVESALLGQPFAGKQDRESRERFVML